MPLTLFSVYLQYKYSSIRALNLEFIMWTWWPQVLRLANQSIWITLETVPQFHSIAVQNTSLVCKSWLLWMGAELPCTYIVSQHTVLKPRALLCIQSISHSYHVVWNSELPASCFDRNEQEGRQLPFYRKLQYPSSEHHSFSSHHQ